MGISYDTQLVTCNRYEDALAKAREDPCRKAYPKTIVNALIPHINGILKNWRNDGKMMEE